MRFLCVSCDTQMNLFKNEEGVVPDERGSLSLKYECPECLVQIAMLTNPFETQMVSSLGVEIGGKTLSEGEGIIIDEKGEAVGVKSDSTSEESGKCPFSEEARRALGASSERTEPSKMNAEINWTAQALVRLKNIPEFVRPMAKQGIEKYAIEQGYTQVNEECLASAKEHFGM